jgi:Siphovirus Gp157
VINPRLDMEMHIYTAIKEWLRAEDPAIDEQTLADTVEGETDLTETLAAIVRAAEKDQADAEALAAMRAKMKTRHELLLERSRRRKARVAEAMDEVHMKRLAMPDFTASVRDGTPSVIIFDPAMIPKQYTEERVTLHVSKSKIGEAIKNGEHVPGAELSNKGRTLMVRA